MGKSIKVKYSKLGRQKAWGMAHSEGCIEIDERLKGSKHLEILLHECLHILYPLDSESDIVRNSVILMRTLWKEGYRRVENHEDMPVQKI